MTGFWTLVIVTLVTLAWSSTWLRDKAAPLGQLADWLRPWWWALLLLSLVMMLSFRWIAPHYGAVQVANDLDALTKLIRPHLGRYIAAAIVDVAFAAVYGLFALSLVPMVRGWTDADPWGAGLRRIGSVGCGALLAGALFDELENVTLLRILYGPAGHGGHTTRGDDWVNRMVFLGSVKWSLLAVGAVLVLTALTVRVLSFPGTQQWLGKVWVPYSVYLGLTAGFVAAAAAHQRWMFWALVPALLICGSWLNERTLDVPAAINDLGLARVRVTLLQIALAVILLGVGLRADGFVGDLTFVLGAALLILALGALVTEARRALAMKIWPWVLMAAALVAVAVGVLGAGKLALPALFLLAAVAIVVGEVATELIAERFQDCHAGEPAPVVKQRALKGLALLGLLAIAAVFGLMHADHVAAWQAVAFVGFLIIVVWMASIDGDALVVVALLALLLVASTRPTERAPDKTLMAEPGAPYILVLGDSYTSGEGAHTFLTGTNDVVHNQAATDPHTNECRRAPTAWPLVLAQKVRDASAKAKTAPSDGSHALPSRVLFLACSGDVAENIRTTPRFNDKGVRAGADQLALYKQAESVLGRKPDLVIVGIGGNDAGFGDVVQTCIGPGNCAEIGDEFLKARHDHPGSEASALYPVALRSVPSDLEATYQAIRYEVGDDVPIIATSYPRPVTVHGGCAGALLSGPERKFIASFADKLNKTIERTARHSSAKVSFLDISDALGANGLQLCAGGPSHAGLNFLAFGSKGGTIRDSLNPKNWAHNSAHPNEVGHRVLADAAYGLLKPNWPLDARHPVTLRLPGGPPDVVGPDTTPTNPPDCYLSGHALGAVKGPRCETIKVWQEQQVRHLYRAALPLLTVVMLLFSACFLGPVLAGRQTGFKVFSAIAGLWGKI